MPAFAEISRVVKPSTFCVSFYGWNAVEAFAEAWRLAGLGIVGHIVFAKPYPSSTRVLQHQHENAFLLAKGDVRSPNADQRCPR
ncbi:MAG: hypothetical protein WDN02_12800 [Methylovirgula sp.]|uniref:hypothetical protein n=1 Tax=Methylovirgula sp. TaxID=1978224 RepID=UPI0030763E1A